MVVGGFPTSMVRDHLVIPVISVALALAGCVGAPPQQKASASALPPSQPQTLSGTREGDTVGKTWRAVGMYRRTRAVLRILSSRSGSSSTQTALCDRRRSLIRLAFAATWSFARLLCRPLHLPADNLARPC